MNEKVASYRKEKFGLFMGSEAGISCYILVSTYLLYFYTNVVGLDVRIVSGIILASKIFDGISDIAFGSVIDNTRSKYGSCRVWLMRILVPYAVSAVLLFAVPGNVGAVPYVYVFISYNLFLSVCYTIQGAALNALPLYITRDKGSVTWLMMFSFLGVSIFALIVSNFTMTWITMLGGDRMAWVKLVVILGGVSCVTQLICIFCVRENIQMDDFTKGKKENIFVMIKAMFSNKYWIQAVLIDAFISAVQISMGVTSAYFAQYIVGDVNKVGVITASFLVPPIFAFMASGAILQKISRKSYVIIMIIVGLLGQTAIVFGSAAMAMPAIYLGMGLKGMAYATICYTSSAMLADSVEYGYWKTGIRTQSVAMGGRAMGEKLSAGLVTALIGGILGRAGYDGMVQVQSASALSTIYGLFVWLPYIFFGVVAIIICFYHLDKEYPMIMKELADREKPPN